MRVAFLFVASSQALVASPQTRGVCPHPRPLSRWARAAARRRELSQSQVIGKSELYQSCIRVRRHWSQCCAEVKSVLDDISGCPCPRVSHCPTIPIGIVWDRMGHEGRVSISVGADPCVRPIKEMSAHQNNGRRDSKRAAAEGGTKNVAV